MQNVGDKPPGPSHSLSDFQQPPELHGAKNMHISDAEVVERIMYNFTEKLKPSRWRRTTQVLDAEFLRVLNLNTFGIISRAVWPELLQYANQPFNVDQNRRGCEICDALIAAAPDLNDQAQIDFIRLMATGLRNYFSNEAENVIIQNEKGTPPWNMIGEEREIISRGSRHDELDDALQLYPPDPAPLPPIASRATLQTMDRIIGLLHLQD